MTKNSTNPAVQVKKEHDKKARSEVRTHTDGTKYKLHSVASYVIREAQLKIVKPIVPIIPIKGAEDRFPEKFWENPMDAKYQQAMADYDAMFETVAVDAMALFGIELLSPIPDDRKWLKNLQRMRLIDEIPDDEYELEFLYKKYIISKGDVQLEITAMSGLTREGVADAIDSFRSNEE